ncbi:hypothetical protein ACET8V_05400 [Aeromonas veronii]
MLIVPYNSIILIEKSRSQGLHKDGTVCTILLSSILEAFLHDIYAHFHELNKDFLTENKSENRIVRFGNDVVTNDPKDVEIMNFLQDMEKSKIDVLNKYHQLANFLNVSWEKGDLIHQDITTLIKIRNLLAHPKSTTLKIKDKNRIICPSSYPKVISDLIQRKIIIDKDVRNSWIHLLDSEEYIIWARKAMANAISKIYNSLPDTPISNIFTENYSYAIGADKY